MTNLIEYEFYKGECITSVDRTKEIITMCERSGWSRCYTLTFKDLLKYAKQWDIHIDLTDSDKTLAKVGTNIILANNAVEHGLDPFRYVKKSKNITHPRDLDIINKFESLFNKYESEKVLAILTEQTKEKIKNSFLS